MLYISKIADYLKISTDDEVKDFLVINFGEYFKSTREKLYFKLSKEKSLRRVEESFYSFVATPDEVDKYVELTEKLSESKIVIQLSSSDNSVCIIISKL